MSPRSVELPAPDPRVHAVGMNHSPAVGTGQLNLLEFYGLQPESDLLEIGCGIGRLAYALGPWLDRGTYAGFDISRSAIRWLNRNYAPLLPNFRFDLVDARNARYRARGWRRFLRPGRPADQLRFPYDDEWFDFACSFSVFTHMRLPDIRHYLTELARVLRPGGLGLMTYYAITDLDASATLKGFGPFVALGDGAYTATPDLPEQAIGFDHELFLSTVADAGLTAVEAVEGRWHGRNPVVAGPGFDQDFVVLSPA